SLGQSTSAATVMEPRRTGPGSPLTLQLADPSGRALELVYVEGAGWKYGAAKSRGRTDRSLIRKIAFGSTMPAPAAPDLVQYGEALTVFIDGPSGFTYVWNREGGWMFVGTLTARR